MVSYEELTAWIDSSALHQQIQNVDVVGLFTNPWFIVPLLVFVCYSLFQKNFIALFFTGLAIGVWYLCGTDYMKELAGAGGPNMSKILPVLGVAAVGTVALILFLFGRSD